METRQRYHRRDVIPDHSEDPTLPRILMSGAPSWFRTFITCTLLGVPSWVRFCRQEFGEFRY